MTTQKPLTSISGLYVITDTQLMNPYNVIDKVEQALKGGAKIVQFRDKIHSQAIQKEQALKLKKLCQDYQACFIVNDNIQLAKQVEADGVHIGKDDTDIAMARKLLGKDAIIGVSCYNDLQRAIHIQTLGASYVAFGRFFPSKTKPDAPQADLTTLTQAHHRLNIPIVAIGGINKNNAQALIKAGANSVAVIQGVFACNEIKAESQAIQNLFK